MRLRAALLAVVLATPTAAVGQAAQTAAPPAATPPASAAPAASPVPATASTVSDVARIKRRLEGGTPLRDAALTSPAPTFRTSVTEEIDIWKYWGEPDAVAAFVRPKGGTWHHEFQNMVTPDEFKGYGGILSNGEKMQLAATSLAFAGAMKLLGMGVQHARDAAQNRSKREAREEVQRELEAFYALHPEARPTTPLSPP
ncbi:MAG: hypothetical protein ABIT71_02215 [Vicinamibacteraceae bacterium]